MSYGSAVAGEIGKWFGCFIMVIVVFLIIILAFTLDAVFGPDGGVIESTVKIVPDYRLEANGKKVDTIWIYKNK